MIKLRINKNGALVIDGKNNESIFNWHHRSFFRIVAGFEVDPKNQEYIFANKKQIFEILSETINYLKEENIDFQLDDKTSELLNKTQLEQQAYEEAKKAGLAFLNNKHLIDQPNGFARKLKHYQLRGYGHLIAVKNGANFSVPGSGKTSVIYAVFEKLRQEKLVDKLLVIGPRSCFLPWEEEFYACFARVPNSVRITGTKRERQTIYLQTSGYELLLCTYQTATNDQDDIIDFCKKHKVYLVLDESHNIKRIEGGVWADAMLNVSRYAIHRSILSGTPVPNNYSDLWTQITFLWPGEQILGDRVTYQYRCEDEMEIEKIRKSIQPFLYRVTKPELGLPKPIFIRHEFELSPYQASIYNALSLKYLQELDVQFEEKIILREWRKARMVRLIQTASNPALLAKYSEEFGLPPISGEGISVVRLIEKYPKYEIPSKIEGATKLICELISVGEKVVLWTSFIHNIEMLRSYLKDIDLYVVYGAVPKDESEDTEFNREQQIRQFKASKGSAVLLANPAACAESISLHKVCHHAIYLDRTFNCGQYLQSLDRIHRVGLSQDEIVTYHLLIAKKTIDETIDRRLIEKENRMLKILEDELPIGSFTVEDNQLGQTEEEEKIDFEETIKDLRRHRENIG
jgi:SNF2 family DNA or RNA helicase